MKRCQKCNRTYPDDNQKFCTNDGGLLVNADQAFDPNATIQSTSGFPPPPPPQGETVDLNATITSSSNAETAVLPRNTGPTGAPTFAPQGTLPLSPQSPSASLPPSPAPQQPSAPLPPSAVGPAKKKSKLPLILGILAVLLVLGAGVVVAAFFLVIKPRLDQMQPDAPVASRTTATDDDNLNTNSNTSPADAPPTTTQPEFNPPADAVRFENSPAKLDGKLAEHYVDFSFYYPKSWTIAPRAGGSRAGSFVAVEKTQEDQQGIYVVENANVSWYNSNGTFESDSPVFQDRVKEWETTFASGYPGYQRVSEGEAVVNAQKAYEVRFMGTFKNAGAKDLPYWGKVIFIPSGTGEKTGALITLLATSLAPGISSADDIGVNGDIPIILKSFKLGKAE